MLINDHLQNFKRYQIPKAQLIIADIPCCYDKLTECRTVDGWKKYNEITKDDIVMSLNHKTKEISYSGIEKIIIKENDEEMYQFSVSQELFSTSIKV